jgi:hypothetical protein
METVYFRKQRRSKESQRLLDTYSLVGRVYCMLSTLVQVR